MEQVTLASSSICDGHFVALRCPSSHPSPSRPPLPPVCLALLVLCSSPPSHRPSATTCLKTSRKPAAALGAAEAAVHQPKMTVRPRTGHPLPRGHPAGSSPAWTRLSDQVCPGAEPSRASACLSTSASAARLSLTLVVPTLPYTTHRDTPYPAPPPLPTLPRAAPTPCSLRPSANRLTLLYRHSVRFTRSPTGLSVTCCRYLTPCTLTATLDLYL